MRIIVDEISLDPFRSVDIHEYPYADWPEPEDMGRAAMMLRVSGRLNTTARGGKIQQVYTNQKAFIDSVSTVQGAGTLVHPSLGNLTAWCLRASFSNVKDKFGSVLVSMDFVLVDPNANPNLTGGSISTQLTLFGYSVSSLVATARDYIGDVTSLIGTGLNLVAGVTTTVGGLISLAKSIPTDAAGIFNCVEGLGFALGSTVTLGRYANGNLTQAPQVLSQLPNNLTVPDLMTQGTALLINANVQAQATVAADANNLTSVSAIISASTAATVASSIQTLIADTSAALNDPGDQLRLLSQLASYQSPTVLAGGAETAALIRRTALCAIANSVSNYDPISSNDAEARIAFVLPLFDAEIEYAGDQNNLLSFDALQQMRQGIFDDLSTRAANLPEVINVAVPSNLPACVIAQRLYQDGSRDMELIVRNDPIHPGFMNSVVEALSF